MGKKDRRRDGLAPPRDAACQRGSGGKGRLLGRVLQPRASFYVAFRWQSFGFSSADRASYLTQLLAILFFIRVLSGDPRGVGA